MHAVDPDGDIVAQWDGLGTVWEGWRAGGKLIQLHTLDLPSIDIELFDSLQLWVGLYEPNSLQRWQSEYGDRVSVGIVELP